MKKITTIIAAIACCAALTACGSTPKDTPSEDVILDTASKTDRYAGLKVRKAGITDRVVFYNLSDLENYCSLAVVGTFIDDAEQEIKYEYNDFFGKEIIIGVESTSTIRVSRVLMGDGVEVGDELKINQEYAVVDGELISFSDLTPMQNGDEWVFFLIESINPSHYTCAGEGDSRFPTKNSASKNIRTALATKPELGVYEEENFNQAIYDEVVAKYGV